MALASGTRLGPYEIVALLGAGGMGEVYRARDSRLRREVALKVLHPGPHADGRRLLQEARVVSTLCRNCPEVGDWTRDGRHVAVSTTASGTISLGLADAATGQTVPLASSADGRSLNRPHLSYDNRWIAFRAMRPPQQVYVAPFDRARPIPESDWIAIGSPEADVRPVGWSPSGRMLYLFSSRDGFRCLYAQRIEVGSGRPFGEATLVRHMHNVRGAGGGGASVISTGAGNAVGRQQIIFDFPDQTVNVWSMRLGPLAPPGAPVATP
jgi:hypothetical protein